MTAETFIDGIVVAPPETRNRREHRSIGYALPYKQVFEYLRNLTSISGSLYRQVAEAYIFEDVIFVKDGEELTPYNGTWRLIDRPSRGGETFLEKASVLFKRDEIETIDAGFFLGSAGSANYGHWLTDDLPRLCLAQDLLGERPVIVSAHGEAIDKVKRASIAVVEPRRPVIMIDRQRFYKVRDITFCDPISMHPVLKSESAMAALISRCNINREESKPKRRIFVDRSDRLYRAIINRDDVTAFCARHGLEIVYTERMDFMEQVRLFADAELIVGIMGAAMTNIIFCDKSVNIIFLAPASWKEPFYFDLCDTLGFSCTTYYGKVDEYDIALDHLQNFYVDFSLIDNVLAESPLSNFASFDLTESNRIIGDCLIDHRLPAISIFEDATYVPLIGPPDGNPEWGLYDSSGGLIEDAAYKRGPGRNLIGQSDHLPISASPFSRIDRPVIYGGMTHNHFGHFLLCVLPRFWSGVRASFPEVKILMHSTTPLAAWLAKPFVRDILATIRVRPDDIFTLPEPRTLSCVIVPGPAFIEQSRAHKVLDSFGAEIGRRMFNRKLTLSEQPLYLSKERIASGIWRCSNEAALAAALERQGVRIFHPEDHNLDEQLATIEEHRFILALQSSALHSTLFCSKPRSIVAIGSAPEMVSNFQLVDALKGSIARYVVPVGGMLEGEPSPFFQLSRVISDPEACAKLMINML